MDYVEDQGGAPEAGPPVNSQYLQDGPRDEAGRFRPGHSGNPHGRPVGARNRTTLLAHALIDNDLENLMQTLIGRALKGDRGALKLCIERILAPKRDAPVEFDLPPLATAEDGTKALAAIVAATANGELTPSEATRLAGIVGSFLRAVEAQDLERRLQALEEKERALALP